MAASWAFVSAALPALVPVMNTSASLPSGTAPRPREVMSAALEPIVPMAQTAGNYAHSRLTTFGPVCPVEPVAGPVIQMLDRECWKIWTTMFVGTIKQPPTSDASEGVSSPDTGRRPWRLSRLNTKT